MQLKKIVIGITLVSAMTMTGCSKVPAGYRGVIVNSSPYNFNH